MTIDHALFRRAVTDRIVGEMVVAAVGIVRGQQALEGIVGVLDGHRTGHGLRCHRGELHPFRLLLLDGPGQGGGGAAAGRAERGERIAVGSYWLFGL